MTFTTCVPTILQMLLSAPGSQDVDLSKLKMIVGGSALPRSLAKAAMKRGMDVYAGYGQSESCPTLTIMQLTTAQMTGDIDAEVEHRIKAGYAPALVDLRVVNSDMQDVAHDGKDHWRDRCPRAVADHGVPEQPRGVRAALGRRLHAHWRLGFDQPMARCTSPTA